MSNLFMPILQPVLRPLTVAILDWTNASFTPLSLFTASDRGFIYDNNDLSTLFADSAGITPAVVNGPVGLQLDKSKGLALGAELWSGATVSGESQDLGGGVYRIYSSAGVNSFVWAVGVLTAGKWYEVTLTVDSVTTLGGGIRIGDTGEIYTTTGTKRSYFLATVTNAAIKRASAACDIQISSVSFKELPGLHRYQSTAGDRPTLRGTPTGANLAPNNGDFSSATGWGFDPAWSIGSGVASVNTVGLSTSSIRTNAIPAVIGKTYRIRYTITSYTSGSVAAYSGGQTGVYRSAVGTYEDYITAKTTDYLVAFIALNNNTVLSIDNVDVRDVSAGSVSAPYGLQANGVNSWMQTASADFTATDKMTVCMGVRKLSDAATAVVVELSASVFANAGSFWIAAPDSAASNIQYRAGGTATANLVRTGLTAPTTLVICGQSSIAADSTILRVNGSETTFGGDQGTGNFGNYPIYFSRRGGTSLPFNGLDYGGVCIGKTLNASQLSAVERWTAQRTGVTL